MPSTKTRTDPFEATRRDVAMWCQAPGETRVVIGTVTGSVYVAQCHASVIVIDQVEGHSLASLIRHHHNLSLVSAHSIVSTRQMHLTVEDRYGNQHDVRTSVTTNSATV